MNKEQAIANIEGLYPADSQYEQSREIGKKLLEQAKMEIQGWRSEPTEVLIRYAELCMEKETRDTMRELQQQRKWSIH